MGDLFLDNMDEALKIARSLCRRYSGQVRLEEVENAALLGLWQASKRWSPDRGVPFLTYSRPRMRGAVTDWVRDQLQGRKRHIQTVPLSRIHAEKISRLARRDSLEDRELLDHLLEKLPERQREAFRLYHLAGLTVYEIAPLVKRHSTWVSRSLIESMKTLRVSS